MKTDGIICEREVVVDITEKRDTAQVIVKNNQIEDLKESGVDLAFDAMMDLEENADLANFMKSHLDVAEDVEELWKINSDKEIITNQWTGQILR